VPTKPNLDADLAKEDAPANPYDPTSFDSPIINGVAPVLIVGMAILFRMCPLGFLLEGFHVWIHEVGHASVAWLSGRPALPLPLGWTNIQHEKSLLIYSGVLLALGALAVSGWRERKAWPIVLAAALLGTQTYMTWFLSEDRAHLWMIFAGVGGEFYLSAAMIGLFYLELQERFKWGGCRYVVLFIGAASFFESFALWRKVKSGLEGIPYGSMINGENDGGGDMNILVNGFHWTQHRIIFTYTHLADACLVMLIIVYAIFNLRLNRLFHPFLVRLFALGQPTE
jgi:hypothetical protein